MKGVNERKRKPMTLGGVKVINLRVKVMEVGSYKTK